MSGRLYCTWDDGPFVLFSSSSDRGETWTTPMVLSEQTLDAKFEDHHDASAPAIAVNVRGDVAVVWFDRRGLPPPTVDANKVIHTSGYNLRLRASSDGGRSWLPSIQINEKPGRGDPYETRFWGAAIAADAAGHFHPTWINDSDGIQQVWTTKVTLEAPR